MRKKSDPIEGFGEPVATSRLSAMDVQQKEFGVTRMGGGYRMRDVDEFLDEITNSMTALADENRRLRDQAGNGAMLGAPDLEAVARQADEIIRRARDEAAQILQEARSAQPAPPGPTVPAAGDRAAISAFLGREREFLQSLAGLVQGHAEMVKGMAREARDAVAAATSAEVSSRPAPTTERASEIAPTTGRVPVIAPAPEPPVTGSARVAPDPRVEEPRVEPPSAPPEPAGVRVAPEPLATRPEPARTEPEPVRVDEPEEPPEPAEEPAAAARTDRPTEAMEEPVRVEEPEPATVGRTDAEDAPEEGDRSLRDLFWGED